ncbi:hypothetical protein VC83_07358 [Pseudogymnoascus destructans]|uniref:3-keto-steroid reductase n=2 Tax=Pseudogymnoascus destructans TaxID=655981 RepID=L8GD53_PSED2|nr:uncharacterized protein VC83_07358 [Pseudogymnoascus destructans]ELR10021.1 hypothetical protein GMDG_04426 [Pseudogymnoascus destructans 20631-21]OAF56035.1 hypothetical protein VC83_07358 [Pseudogymnoascus destructans]
MGLPPWTGSSSQRFVLVTGSNSGLGLATCERLIDEFLTSPTRDPLSHLIIVVSTRSPRKTAETINSLRQHLQTLAKTSTELEQRASSQTKEYQLRDAVGRVHFLGAEVDLCDLRGIYKFASQIRGQEGGLSSPDIEDGRPGLKNVIIPRLDVLYLNAGIGGWTGIPWVLAIYKAIVGIPDSFSYWKWFNFPSPAAVVRHQSSFNKYTNAQTESLTNGDLTEEPPLGEVFCANVFGHYLLAHELMPLLSTSLDREPGDRARVIWVSTLEPNPTDISMDDLQGFTASNPYYGSKRVTDLLSITAKLPAIQPINNDFFAMRDSIAPKPESDDEAEIKLVRPEFYVTQPGILHTNISGMNPFAAFFMALGFYIARVLGGVWHPIVGYLGAVAPVWLGLADQSMLDSLDTRAGPEGKIKWGSSTDWWANERVRMTEVVGWGWSGYVGEKGEKKGRAPHAVDLTPEAREEFVADGRVVWGYLEGLRREWEGRLKVGDAA